MSMLSDLTASGPRGALTGQILLAMPGMEDARFKRSVIYVCAHSREGTMGIVINHTTPKMTVRDLLVQLDVIEPEQAIRLPRRVSHAPVLRGGPVETSRGFVIHSDDYWSKNSTQAVADGICMTATVEILKAMTRDQGPQSSLLALGYSGWSAGQLEREIAQNSWLHCSADANLLFDTDLESKYDRAMRKIGIDPAMLSQTAGRA
jgi:putative transcriptional regulator